MNKENKTLKQPKHTSKQNTQASKTVAGQHGLQSECTAQEKICCHISHTVHKLTGTQTWKPTKLQKGFRFSPTNTPRQGFIFSPRFKFLTDYKGVLFPPGFKFPLQPGDNQGFLFFPRVQTPFFDDEGFLSLTVDRSRRHPAE